MYLTVCGEKAIKTAEEIDQRRAEGERLPPLAGIPMALKDNICTEGVRTSCASKILDNFIPPYSASVYKMLQKQGTILLGKLNMDEFAMGSTNENSAFHVTKNPLNPAYVPGGSSGGSAAAVASREAVFTLGSDTGGSIRLPASFCGVIGMKPTYGRVSRYGLIAFASSLDQIGPLTRTVADNALVLGTISGADPRDMTSASVPVPNYTAELGKSIKGLRIGLPNEFFEEGLSAEVKTAILRAAKKFEGLGAEVVEVSLSTLKQALPAYYVLSSAEASSNLARYDGVRYGARASAYEDISDLYRNTRSEGFGSEVKRRILLGTFALSAGYFEMYYQNALKVRSLVKQDFAQAFTACDVLLSPVAPMAAYRIGETLSEPLQMYSVDLYTVPVSLAGLPALSMPCGIGDNHLPIGMQLIAPAFGEGLLYRVGYLFEQEGDNGIV